MSQQSSETSRDPLRSSWLVLVLLVMIVIPAGITLNTVRFPGTLDLAYATMGGHVLRNSYRLVRPGSELVSIVEAPDIEEASRLGILATFVFVEPNGAEFQEIT